MISCRTHDGQQKCDRIQGELDELEETWLGKKQMIFSNALFSSLLRLPFGDPQLPDDQS